MAVWAAFVALTAFYLIPIIAIQGLINVDQLRRIAVIGYIIDLPVIRSIITAILPGAPQAPEAAWLVVSSTRRFLRPPKHASQLHSALPSFVCTALKPLGCEGCPCQPPTLIAWASNVPSRQL